MYLKEIAVENFTDIPRAVHSDVNRIELNDNLAVGGTTPSHGVLAETTNYLADYSIPLVLMIRPRGGNFVYNDTELKIMESDLFNAQQFGVDAVAFGCLTADGDIDEEALEMLIGASSGMETVFHMAFDQIPLDKQKEALDLLVEHKVTRILTHGGDLSRPIDETIPHLKEIISYADGRIEILPGGGITYENADRISEELNVPYLHGTKIVEYK